MSLLALILFYFQQEVEEEFPTKSDEATPPPASEEAHPPPPAAWRYLSFPSDHVMLLGCSGDEFTVRIMPRLEGLEQQSLREANGDLRPDGCLRPAAGTLSVYNREPHYDAVFWALPGQEKCVPVPVPSRESEAAVGGRHGEAEGEGGRMEREMTCGTRTKGHFSPFTVPSLLCS